MRVQNVKRYSENVVIVDTMSGKAGEEGVVYDSESGKSRFSMTENDVPVSSARAILVSPPLVGTWRFGFQSTAPAVAARACFLSCLRRYTGIRVG